MPFHDRMYDGVRANARMNYYQHDETDDDMIRLKANEVTSKIRELERQLISIQSNCPHTKEADAYGDRTCRYCFKVLKG